MYPIRVMSRVFNVKPSGYYAWLKRKPSLRSQRDSQLEIHIRVVHEQTRRTYGVERLHAELVEQGVDITPSKVRSLRKKLEIRCKQNRRFKCTTNSQHNKRVAPNLLEQNFAVERPNQVWVSDITYVWTNEGWLYVAGVKDLFTREIVGYAVDKRMTTELCISALNMAIKRRKPKRGLILHSDRGSQYCAKDYTKRAESVGMVISMSRKGNCYDNAPIESFWGTLKNEMIHQQTWNARDNVKSQIVEFIEVFYNRIRRHTQIGNISPAQAWANFYANAA